MKRGDVVVAEFPVADGRPGIVRPCVIVQADDYNKRINNVVLATITSNLARRDDPAHCLIEVGTEDGRLTGLTVDSLISCINLATLRQSDLGRVIGTLSPKLLVQLNDCLKTALDLR